jgi:hypothetical protein
VRISIDLPTNPKLAALNNPVAAWAYVVSVTNCGASSSDGHFVMALVLRIAGATKKAGMALVKQGLWHLPGHDCARCPQPEPGNAFLHDFLLHNRSAADVKKLTEKRRDAGKAGAAARWANGKKGVAKPMASAMASAEQMLWQMDGKPMAEERREEDKRPTAPTALPATRALAVVPDPPTLTTNQRSKAITDAYAAVEKLCKWPAVNAIVIKAINAEKWSDDEIRDALLRLAADNRTVTVDSLRVELTGPPKTKAVPRQQTREVNGMHLSDRNVAAAERADRIAALQAQIDLTGTRAIEGSAR